MNFQTPGPRWLRLVGLVLTVLLAALLTVLLTGCPGSAPNGDAGGDGANVSWQEAARRVELSAETAEKLWHHRNLGKAFYENPATQYDAIAELKAALDLYPDSVCDLANYGMALMRAGQVEEGIAELEKAQAADPTLPHTWFNLGVAYKQRSEYEAARVQFERMVELVPEEPISHYNLAALYKLESRTEEAITHFERSAELDGNLAGPHFQLATAYRQVRRADDAKQAMLRFRDLKKRNEGEAVPEDLEWSFYSELCAEIDPSNVRDDAPPAELRFESRKLAQGLDPGSAGLAVIDVGDDGSHELLAWSKDGLRVFTDLTGEAAQRPSGLEQVGAVKHVAPADFDNDGLIDLALAGDTGVALYRQQAGKFHPVDVAATATGIVHQVVWLDYDHDYDLDLVALGPASTVYRNNGEAGWSEYTDFPFAPGEALAGARFDLVADTQGMDLAVLYAGGDGVLYRDFLGGVYQAEPLPGFGSGTARSEVLAADFNHDGWTDLAAVTKGGARLLVNNHAGGLEPAATSDSSGPMLFFDAENRGVMEWIVGGGLSRNQGLGQFAEAVPVTEASIVAWAAADLDGDGLEDLAGVTGDGDLLALDNRTQTSHTWMTVALNGVKNPSLAPGAEIEVKAGRKYQKKIYRGLPLHFGLGNYAEVDTVRITWPNGLIQNEAKRPTGQAHLFEEAQRLSGSCPMIYTWNGAEFEFITDVLGVAPLGASAGDGEYFPVDHTEYIQIAGESLAARDGKYEIRITEELREIAYLDEIRLIAVDHPQDVDVFTNDKFKGPPFPEFQLFSVDKRFYPVTATDPQGRDVRPRLAALDKTYPDGFARDYSGVAELHHLDLDFGAGAPADQAILVLSGWVDWADGSTFLGASQESDVGLIVPYLQVKDDAGVWRTVIEDMGMPAGKPKTIVVDLSGKFLSASREVRIVTNLCLYWDEIFLAVPQSSEIRLTDLHAEDAGLRFRGFSGVVIHPERKQPEHFVYATRRPLSMWNPTRGLYTRFGDVRPLLEEVDDRYVIMGSGDEIRLLFDAISLPELPRGWRRGFLLFVDGWAKDGDANTAHSQTVEPLPYHGMPQYPYAAPHHFPDGSEHLEYRQLYNTRPALRLIRPLSEGLAP